MKPVDVEGVLSDYLTALGITAGRNLPNPAPDEFVRVSRAGGPTLNVIEEEPTMLFEFFAGSLAAAFDLAAKAYEAISAADRSWLDDGETVWCNGSRPSAPINFPDPTYETRSRYQFYAPMRISLEDS